MISKLCHHWAKSSAKGREQGGHGTSARSRRPCSHLRDVHLLTLLGEVVRRKRRWRRRICWGGEESVWDWHRGNKLPDGEVDQLRLFRRWQRVFDHLGKILNKQKSWLNRYQFHHLQYLWNTLIHIKIKYYQGYPLFGVERRDGGETKTVDSQVNL